MRYSEMSIIHVNWDQQQRGEGDTNNQTMNKKYTINMNLNVVYN